MQSIRDETEAFAKRISAMGFEVYIAQQRTYGFITDDKRTRVLVFSLNDMGSLGGAYGPPSTTSGTGWRMDIRPHQLQTADQVREALYSMPPSWSRGGWRYMSTVEQYLAQYDSSSKFTRYINEGEQS
jgi:hypothetical protein